MSHPEKLIQPPYRLREEDTLYFLHIPKTAGTTVAHLLESHFSRAQICPVHLLKELARQPREEFSHYRLFWGHFGYRLAEFVPREMIHVTFLRHPVEQVISFYQFIRRNPQHYLHHKVNRECPSVDHFVRDPSIVPHIRNPQAFHFFWDSCLLDRVPSGIAAEDIHYMEEIDARLQAMPEGERRKAALDRLNRFAFVGLTEQLEESLRLLAFTFRWKDFDAIPRLNTAPQQLATAELSAEALTTIRELTRLDAELYAHAQQLFAQRLQTMQRARSFVPSWFHGFSSKRSQVLP